MSEQAIAEKADAIEALVEDGELEQARELLSEALAEFPSSSDLLLIKAELTLDAEAFGEVISLCNSCLSRDDLSVDDLARFAMLKAYALYYTDEFDEARQMFNQAIGGDHELWSAIVGRAMVHDHMGFLTAAMLDLDRAIELDDQEAEPFAVRGMIFLRQGLIEEAQRDLQYAIDADEDDEESRLNLGRLLALEGRTSEALEILEPLCDGDDRDPDYQVPALLLRSQLSLNLKSTSAAMADAERAAEIWDDKPWGHLQLAAAHLTAMQAGEAIAALKEAEKRVGNSRDVPDISALMASAYTQLEKPEKAQKAAAKVEGMARLPQIVYGVYLNPAADIPINPAKPIDIRAILTDLFGEASRAPEGYEEMLREIVERLPEIIQEHPGVETLNIQLPDAPGMVQTGRQLIIQVNAQARQQG